MILGNQIFTSSSENMSAAYKTCCCDARLQVLQSKSLLCSYQVFYSFQGVLGGCLQPQAWSLDMAWVLPSMHCKSMGFNNSQHLSSTSPIVLFMSASASYTLKFNTQGFVQIPYHMYEKKLPQQAPLIIQQISKVHI